MPSLESRRTDMNPNYYEPSQKNWEKVMLQNEFWIWEARMALLNHEVYRMNDEYGNKIMIDSEESLMERIFTEYDLYCMPYFLAEAEADEKWQENYSNNIRF